MAYHWARRGDINAFFGLMLDNVAVMLILFGAVTSLEPVETQLQKGGVRFTPEFVLTRMIPGTALGVLIGDLVYTWMAFRLARRTGRHDVTAMPLGLDTPSTFGVTFLVLIPSLQVGWQRYQNHEQAMLFAWNVGLVALVLCGIFKLLCAPFGNAIRQLVPRAGLLGSLAAIALALIAFLPMVLDGIAAVPLIGMLALLVILITLVAHRELPGRFPGALAAVLLGVFVYLVGQALEYTLSIPVAPRLSSSEGRVVWQPDALLSFYSLPMSWWGPVFAEAFNKLPVVLPFALATVVGGIDCTESALAAGDDYDTRAILFTEAIASVLAGLLGGVIQTTPYIGHPAYKKMGARAAYTLATALFVGIVGYFGGFQYLFDWLPKAAMFTILVFVGLEITAQSFHATRIQHYPGLALAMLPALAYLCLTVLKTTFGPFALPDVESGIEVLQTLRCLANGFLISGLLWAAALALILDGRLPTASIYFFIAAVCALFGIIHSPLPDERIDLPWNVLAQFAEGQPMERFAAAVRYQTPYHWAATYALMATILLVLSWMGSARLPLHVEPGREVPTDSANEKG
jgi:AGZA family xanthine/uracil permease-like MFS transporter